MPRRNHGLFKGDSCLSNWLVGIGKRLHRIGIDYETAVKVCRSFSRMRGVAIPRITIHNRQCNRYGFYRPHDKMIRLNAPQGMNVETVLHELAHHICWAEDRGHGHNAGFRAAYKWCLQQWTKGQTVGLAVAETQNGQNGREERTMNTGRNVDVKVSNGKLVITVDLKQDLGPSKSGKTHIIASTGGNQLVDPDTGAILGLNVYRKV